MASKSYRVAVLVSGRGSNMVSLLEAGQQGKLPHVEFAVVLSNRPNAPALEKAQNFGVPTVVIDHRAADSREAFDAQVVEALRSRDIDLVCLAGFMRILSPVMIEAFPNAIINIHPSLLPSFPGMDAQQQAFDYGVRISGATVHFVDTGVDTGPIIMQRSVPVLDGDEAEDLRSRILGVEHELYLEALQWLTAAPWHVQGRRVVRATEA